MDDIKIITAPVTLTMVREMAQKQFGTMVKAVVDINTGTMALGGDLHSDEEKLMLENGSSQEHLWGINIYPGQTDDNRIEFDSMINLRPYMNNLSRGVEDLKIQKKIIEIVNRLIKE